VLVFMNMDNLRSEKFSQGVDTQNDQHYAHDR
jgi:hypothetical protein